MKDALGHGSNAHGAGIQAAVPKAPVLAEMPRAKLLKVLAKLDAESSEINRALIEAGHGMVKGQDIMKMSGPLFDRYRDNHTKLIAHRDEREARMRYQGTEHPIKKSKWL